MICSNVVVKIKDGLDSNAIALLIQKASNFGSDIFIEKGQKKANAKSLLGLLSLGISNNQEVKLVIEGKDEEQAMKELKEYLELGL